MFEISLTNCDELVTGYSLVVNGAKIGTEILAALLLNAYIAERTGRIGQPLLCSLVNPYKVPGVELDTKKNIFILGFFASGSTPSCTTNTINCNQLVTAC